MTEAVAQQVQVETQTTQPVGEQSQPAVGQNAPDWATGLGEDALHVVREKGWKNPADAINAYKNLESFVGKQANRAVVIPEAEDDADGWNKVYNRLGRPETPDAYGIEVPQDADDRTKGILGKYKEIAHNLGLNNRQAIELQKNLDAYVGEIDAKTMESASHQAEQELHALKKEWGMAYDDKVALAQKAAAKFANADLINSMEAAGMGTGEIVKMFANIGSQFAEDAFVSSDSPRGFGAVLTPEQAKQDLAELKADKDYTDTRTNPERYKMLQEKAKRLYAMMNDKND